MSAEPEPAGLVAASVPQDCSYILKRRESYVTAYVPVLIAVCMALPLLVACGEAPPRVPVLHEPGQYKTCPGGRTDC